MRSFAKVLAAAAAIVPFLPSSLAQSGTPVLYTDQDSGISFDTWTVPDTSTKGELKIGVALPEDALETDATEFIGLLQCASKDETDTGWCGLSLGGPMTNSLLLMMYPFEDEILTSFRFSPGYDMPDVYSGDAELTQISATINATHYTLIYRCQNCLQWAHGAVTGAASTSAGYMVLGWSQNLVAPGNPSCPSAVTLDQHDNGQGIFGAQLENAPNPSYTDWVELATATVTGTCETSAPTTTSSVPVPTGTTYDYVVVGGGAGGITVADKLSESGASVLLIEKGPPSAARWGGTLGPDWLEGEDLTRFDVPGLCNQIWVDSAGIACSDTDQMTGCVLGGGTAVNAGLWWKPYPLDWDYNFPDGWKASDMQAATQRVFSRIPGTDTPSMDGQRYLQEGFNVLTGGFETAGWKSVVANDAPAEKNHTYAHTPYMFSGGERGGPMATYLVSASERDNFELWMNTAVKRVVRDGSQVTGLEVTAFRDGGYAGTVELTPGTGRVILSAGVFGTAKILMRSGIGPTDQLNIVKQSDDGPTMIDSDSWIDLPVGYNLMDHLNTDTVIEHPDVVFYDFYEAWTDPDPTDADLYLSSRSGILAQAAPNIGPMFWDEIKGADGIVRQLQWTARVEGSHDNENPRAMTMSQYLGRGATSRGRMTINAGLSTIVSDEPYLKDENDKAAVVQGIINLQGALQSIENLNWTYPNSSTTVQEFVDTMLVSYTNRRANHWMGTSKMGTDDGRVNGGSAVVDLDTKVYGMDNLFVVDASIFPGMTTTNPSSYIVIVAERAAERILALKTEELAIRYGQCAGIEWTGPTKCEEPWQCQFQNDYYSQCL